MDPEQLREFDIVGRDILHKLRCHAYIDDQHLVHQFQYLVLPSFSDPIAWDLFCKRRRDQSDEFRLFRTTWHCDLDREKLRTPVERLRHPYPLVPNIEVYELAAPSHELGLLAADLLTLKLPIRPSSERVGLDGVTFEIAIEQPSLGTSATARCRFSWWCEPPVEWDDLRSWLNRAERSFEMAWQEKGEAKPVAPCLPKIDIEITRQEARRQFLAGHYARAAELLMDVASRERLAPSEARMLELAFKQIDIR